MKCFVIIQMRNTKLIKVHHARPKRQLAVDDAIIMQVELHKPHDIFFVRGVVIK